MNSIHVAAVAFLTLVASSANSSAQDSTDIAAIKAADAAFYKALSGRDLKAMLELWANKPYVVNVGPRSKTASVGYDDAVKKYWGNVFENAFSRIEAESTGFAAVQTNGKLAWVSGTEKAALYPKAGGDPIKFDAFVTNVSEKDGDRWLMVSHHAQMIPK